MTIPVSCVWWCAVQLGEFFNIERDPGLLGGGGGARYIEIPTTLVPATLEFLGVAVPVDNLPANQAVATIPAHAIGAPDVVADINFRSKSAASGRRLLIADQNRQAKPNRRHPAWRAERGFPQAPDSVANRFEAEQHYPEGGLRIYLVKTTDGEFYAGFTTGRQPPPAWAASPVMRMLYDEGRGGLIREEDVVG